MTERLNTEGRDPGNTLLATQVEGLTLVVVETRSNSESFVALYGRTGTSVQSLRLVELGRPVDRWSLSLGVDNEIAAVDFVVPAPTVTRVAIRTGAEPDGQPISVDVPIRDGVAALQLNGQRPANSLLELEENGMVVGGGELQAMDVDDPVKAQPSLKPGGDSTAEPEGYRRDNVALASFLGLLALGIAAWIAARRFARRGAEEVSGGRGLWRGLVGAAVVLSVLTPVVVWLSSDAMYDLAYSDPSFDASGLLLQFVPALFVGAAAVRCARGGLKVARAQTTGRAAAVSATVLAYLVAGLLIAAFLFVAIALSQGGG
ncbi:hypothetical protein ACIBL3_19405 [Kribbella sp. NPDC050124]|uniref:hypothetical protein n=1 Tax=Kribbella sp. NPDC050124 TaxID=3364114 RepID=UPI00379BB868